MAPALRLIDRQKRLEVGDNPVVLCLCSCQTLLGHGQLLLVILNLPHRLLNALVDESEVIDCVRDERYRTLKLLVVGVQPVPLLVKDVCIAIGRGLFSECHMYSPSYIY